MWDFDQFSQSLFGQQALGSGLVCARDHLRAEEEGVHSLPLVLTLLVEVRARSSWQNRRTEHMGGNGI